MTSTPAAVERTQQFGAEVEAILKASPDDRKTAVVRIMSLLDRELSRLEETNAILQQAVLDRLAERKEAVEELASETQRRLTFYSQVRDALGCGSRPMIEELPAEIAKLRAGVAEDKRRCRELELEITGLRRSYFEERKARIGIARDSEKAEAAEAIAKLRAERDEAVERKSSPCCEHMAERMRQKNAEARALATLRDRGFKLSPAQAEKAVRAASLTKGGADV